MTIQLNCPDSCPFVKSGCKAPVMPDGKHGGILIIGEAPGFDEVKKGHGFAGIAGRNLYNAFLEFGYKVNHIDGLSIIKKDIVNGLLSYKEIPIARVNAVLCHPVKDGKNRKPSVAELKACSQNLKTTIQHYQPKVILAVGQSAFNALGFTNPFDSFITLCQSNIQIYFMDARVFLIPHTSPLSWNMSTNGIKHKDIGIANKRKALEYFND